MGTEPGACDPATTAPPRRRRHRRLRLVRARVGRVAAGRSDRHSRTERPARPRDATARSPRRSRLLELSRHRPMAQRPTHVGGGRPHARGDSAPAQAVPRIRQSRPRAGPGASAGARVGRVQRGAVDQRRAAARHVGLRAPGRPTGRHRRTRRRTARSRSRPPWGDDHRPYAADRSVDARGRRRDLAGRRRHAERAGRTRRPHDNRAVARRRGRPPDRQRPMAVRTRGLPSTGRTGPQSDDTA